MAGATIRGYSAVQLLHGWYHVVTGLFGCYTAGATWLQNCLVITWPGGNGLVWLLHGWYHVVTELFGFHMAGGKRLQRCLVVTWLVSRGCSAVWLLHA